MIGPLVAATFVCDGLTLQWRIGRLRLGLRRPPVLSLILLYVFVLVPALFHVHTVRVIDADPARRQPLDALFAAWARRCAPGTGPVQPVIVAVSGGATRAGLWGAAVLDRVLQAQQPGGPALFAVSSVSGGSLGVGRSDDPAQPRRACPAEPHGPRAAASGDGQAGAAGWRRTRSAARRMAAQRHPARRLRPDRGGDPLGDGQPADTAATAPRRSSTGSRISGARRGPKGAPGWDQPFLSLFYTDHAGTYREGMPLWFANGTDATTGNRVITAPIAAPAEPGRHDAVAVPGRARLPHADAGRRADLDRDQQHGALPVPGAVRRDAPGRRSERRSARWSMAGISRTRGCRPRWSSPNGLRPILRRVGRCSRSSCRRLAMARRAWRRQRDDLRQRVRRSVHSRRQAQRVADPGPAPRALSRPRRSLGGAATAGA